MVIGWKNGSVNAEKREARCDRDGGERAGGLRGCKADLLSFFSALSFLCRGLVFTCTLYSALHPTRCVLLRFYLCRIYRRLLLIFHFLLLFSSL